MSRRARKYAQSRPWLQQRDAADTAGHIERVLQMVDDQDDEHLRERAWEQYEAEQQGVQA